jgi:hypothetical protein
MLGSENGATTHIILAGAGSALVFHLVRVGRDVVELIKLNSVEVPICHSIGEFVVGEVCRRVQDPQANESVVADVVRVACRKNRHVHFESLLPYCYEMNSVALPRQARAGHQENRRKHVVPNVCPEPVLVKKIVYIYIWLNNTAPLESMCGASLQAMYATKYSSLRKTVVFVLSFPMFVPSLSWQNDAIYIKMAQKCRFSDRSHSLLELRLVLSGTAAAAAAAAASPGLLSELSVLAS